MLPENNPKKAGINGYTGTEKGKYPAINIVITVTQTGVNTDKREDTLLLETD